MKTLLSIILMVAASSQFLHAQTTQTITYQIVGDSSLPFRDQDIPVLAGETFEVLTWKGNASLKVDDVNLPVDHFDVAGYATPKVVVAGPKTVSLRVPANASLVCTYTLTTNSAAATQNVASSAVVIPADAAASVDIILESSTDLITWTAALPGSYSPSTTKRFFRVRLVQH